MVAKMVLPILGGAPMVWNACMVFFQVTLLAGYVYAHSSIRWVGGRTHIALHALLLLVPFLVLPVLIQRGTIAPTDGNPIGWLLLLLAGTIGLPFLVLSTTASVLQHWFSRTDHPAAADPYFLYAASNVGSFVALACYPAVVEPLLAVGDQSRLWTIGYGVFVALAAACALVAWRTPARPTVDSTVPAVAPLTWPRRVRWVALAFIPSSLMLAVTTYLSTDIGSVPLLWILPLSLYLLTFVVAFGAGAERGRRIARHALPPLLVSLALLMITTDVASLPLVFALHILTFMSVAMYCHGTLAADRPEAAHLTEFYLWVSFGGMLGGMFNSLAAPMLFSRVVEYPLALTLACLWLPNSTTSSRRNTVLDFAMPAGILLVTALIVTALSRAGVSPQLLVAGVAVPAIVAFSQRRRPVRFALSIGGLLLAGLLFSNARSQVLHAERTFFGVYRVSQANDQSYRMLRNGSTLHGMEALAGPELGEPLSYYHRTGPFGQAFGALPHVRDGQRVAVIGLGVGTLAAYATPTQRWTFFEIDPAVERIARDRRYFNYLDRCGARCEVVVGDARLSLARVPPRGYDLLVLDAFSSDSIPIHLMTAEALELYLSTLTSHGAILFHISNRHLTLGPVVANLAAAHNLTAYEQVDVVREGSPKGKATSDWVVMARHPEDLGPIVTDRRWTLLRPASSTPTWTDDFSNILSALRIR
jgi:hypothetical protein